MKRWILFILSIALLYYVALIYHSTSLLFCVFAAALLELGFLLLLVLVFCRLRLDLSAASAVVQQGEEIGLELTVSNRSHLPVGQIRFQIEICYLQAGKRCRLHLRSAIPGRRIRQKQTQTRLEFRMDAQYSGIVRIQVRRASVFDLLGVLSLPLWRTRRGTEVRILALPEQREIPIVLTDRGRDSRQGEAAFAWNASGLPEAGQVREYLPGDALRNIHWKLTAKQDELMVRDFTAVPECVFLFYLDLDGDPVRYLQVMYSVGMELVEQREPFYLVYYEKDTGKLMRRLVKQEEDFYKALRRIDLPEMKCAGWRKKNRKAGQDGRQIDELERAQICLEWEQDYDAKYHLSGYEDALVLWRDLVLTCQGETIWQEGKGY